MTTGGEGVREVVAQIIDQVVATNVATTNANARGTCETKAPTVSHKASKAHTTFPVRQRTYRDLVCRFFADEDRFDRLQRIVTAIPTVGVGSEGEAGSRKKNGRSTCDRMCSIIFYFVKEFEPDRLVRTDAGIFRVCDEYNNAITNYKKRYYNFESKEGSGELVWKGEINPCVSVSKDNMSKDNMSKDNMSKDNMSKDIALPLPRLIALYWFIQFGFDLVLWERFEEVQRSYDAFTACIKRKYTDNHKTKKAERRRKIEQEVLAARSQSQGPGQKLTRTERRLVAQKIEQEKRRRREMRSQKGGAQKRKRKAADYNENARRTSARTKEIGAAVLIEAIDGKNVTLE